MTEESSGRRDVTSIGDVVIDRILAAVQGNLIIGDWVSAWNNMLLARTTPGLSELHDIGQELIDEKNREEMLLDCSPGICDSETYFIRERFYNHPNGFLANQCRKLYDVLMSKLKHYKYLENPAYGPKTKSMEMGDLEKKLEKLGRL